VTIVTLQCFETVVQAGKPKGIRLQKHAPTIPGGSPLGKLAWSDFQQNRLAKSTNKYEEKEKGGGRAAAEEE